MAFPTAIAKAHDVNLTHVEALFHEEGKFVIDFHYDADAWLVGVRPEHLTAADRSNYLALPVEQRRNREDELREFVARRVKLRFDETVSNYDVSLAPTSRAPSGESNEGVVPAHMIRLTGTFPREARAFSLSCSKTFGNIILSQRCGNEPAQFQRMDAGGRSDPFELRFQNGADNKPSRTAQGTLEVSRQFIVLGFEHILPMGLDHIAFVLSLFLLSTKLKPLIWQVTAFTVAHSITLSLAVLGVVRLSDETNAGLVEPLIALSIVYVAVENLFTAKLHAWRPIVVFLFGLLHGLGFARMLLGLGIPEGRYINALASFNIGVELGQLAVIAMALLAVGMFRQKQWYRRRVVIPMSLAISIVGAYWAVERFAGL
ncbi:MAG: HupE/UreJ family protein [Planctomycetes bacterium]|nr:HupE/UreJ family protein [Planctomycetota bacterium]